MSVHKESLKYFEALAKLQTQIFPDSCDYGVPSKYIDKDQLMEKIADLIGLSPYESSSHPVTNCDTPTQRNSVWTITLPIEQDGRYEQGVQLVLTAVALHHGGKWNRWLEIQFKHYNSMIGEAA